MEAWIAAREEAAPDVAIFDSAFVNALDSRGASREFFLGERETLDI